MKTMATAPSAPCGSRASRRAEIDRRGLSRQSEERRFHGGGGVVADALRGEQPDDGGMVDWVGTGRESAPIELGPFSK